MRNRAKPPKGKNCSKCSKLFKGYCNEFKIRITDNINAKICSKYSESKKFTEDGTKKKNTRNKKINATKF